MLTMEMMMIKCSIVRKSDTSYEWTLLIFLIVLQNVDSFNLKCPSQVNWKFRAKVMCNSTMKYFCLYNNVERKYVEGCDGPDWDRKGSKRIFAGYFTRDQCKQERFQPIKFWTNESMSDCLYSKSPCSEEGQLMLKENSTKDDRKCRCDYKNSYSYIKNPRNLCSCIPTDEDCSCHIKTCPANYTLSSDYKCIQSSNQEKSKCKDEKFYVAVDDTNGVLIERNKTWISGPNFILKFKWRATAKVTILIIICFIFVAVGVFSAVLSYDLANVLNGLSGYIQRKKGRLIIYDKLASEDQQSLKGYNGIDQILDAEIDKAISRGKVSMDIVDGNDPVSSDSTSDDKGPANLTAEEVNFLRMIHLLFRVACPVVRMTFDHEIQPNQLRKSLDKNKALMNKRYRQKENIINDCQWGLLYRSVKGINVTSEDFDISLMTTLLRTLAPSIKIGDLYPVRTDTSIGAMLSRIKYTRNETILSYEGKLSQKQFAKYWKESGQAILKLVSSHLVNIEDDTMNTKLIGRLLELNPIHIDYEKLCLFIDMSEKDPSMILKKIVSEFCNYNHFNSIEDVLKQEKHDLYHKRIKLEYCCECPIEYACYIRVIPEKQWEALFEMKANIPVSILHSCTSELTKCYARFVPKRIDTSDLSLSMSLIQNISCILNYVTSRLFVSGFSNFLVQNQHTLYHSMGKGRCCKCKSDPIDKILIEDSEWNKLFKKIDLNSCQGDTTCTMDCCCQFTVITGIEYYSIEKILLSKIFYVAGPISVLKKIGQDKFLHFLSWTIDDEPLRNALTELSQIIQDSCIAQSISSSNVSQMAETKTQKVEAVDWVHRHLTHQKETTEPPRQIILHDEVGLSVKSVHIPKDFPLPSRPQKFTDITAEENNFLVVVYGLTKIVYPVINNHFDIKCPESVLDKIRKDIYDNDCKDSKKGKVLTTKQREQLFSPKLEDSEKKDFKLMIFLLKQRPDDEGKKEDDCQLDVIDSIRREIIQSSSGILNETKFTDIMDRISKAVLHLGGEKHKEDLLNLYHIKNILE